MKTDELKKGYIIKLKHKIGYHQIIDHNPTKTNFWIKNILTNEEFFVKPEQIKEHRKQKNQ